MNKKGKKCKIAILNCYDESRILYNFNGKNYTESGLLELRIRQNGVDTESFNAFEGEFPGNSYNGYVISGSYYNPDRNSISRYPWMAELLKFIRNTGERKKPMLGICFGHQMMGVAFGGRVFELPEDEVGYRLIRLEQIGAGSPLFENVPGEFYGAFNHKWAVYRTSLPFDSKILALSPEIPDQVTAFQAGGESYGVQYHPERVSDDVKIMFDYFEKTGGEKLKFNYKKSSEANVMVLKNFIRNIACRL
ncbi:type 1 glutamine amidotransferase [Candidatus Micrarchaeota archaeon]|nr:type 1 glutamine amidotransferase [Candidatus Micrarchaeota archaeon]